MEYRGGQECLLKVEEELLRRKRPNHLLESSSFIFPHSWEEKMNHKKTAGLVSDCLQGKGSMLSHEKETTTVPFGKDLTGFLFLLAEQQSK